MYLAQRPGSHPAGRSTPGSHPDGLFARPAAGPPRPPRLPLTGLLLRLRRGAVLARGFEEFEESRPACRRSAATSARSASISAACSATNASSSAFRAASSSYEGCSGCGIPEPNHDHKPGTSTDTPQIKTGPDWLHAATTPKDSAPAGKTGAEQAGRIGEDTVPGPDRQLDPHLASLLVMDQPPHCLADQNRLAGPGYQPIA